MCLLTYTPQDNTPPGTNFREDFLQKMRRTDNQGTWRLWKSLVEASLGNSSEERGVVLGVIRYGINAGRKRLLFVVCWIMLRQRGYLISPLLLISGGCSNQNPRWTQRHIPRVFPYISTPYLVLITTAHFLVISWAHISFKTGVEERSTFCNTMNIPIMTTFWRPRTRSRVYHTNEPGFGLRFKSRSHGGAWT